MAVQRSGYADMATPFRLEQELEAGQVRVLLLSRPTNLSQRGNADRYIGRENLAPQDVESLGMSFAKKAQAAATEILHSAGN